MSLLTKLNMPSNRFHNFLAIFYICAVAVSSSNADVDVVRCPAVCFCDDSRQLVDCSYRALARPPLQVPKIVKVFNLAGNRIKQLAAVHLLLLPNLEELDLSDNLIFDIPPDLFSTSSRLKTIDFTGNKFSRIPSFALTPLAHLLKLSMARNEIAEIDVNNLSVFSNLNTLDLSGNSIFKLSSGFLDHFPHLLDLQLSGNHLDSLDLTVLATTNHMLTSLDLSYNSITNLASTTLVLPNLQSLNLTGNQLYAVESSWFVLLPNLQNLEIGHNQISLLDGGTFRFAASLRRLVLSHLSSLMQINHNSFVGLTLLEKLHITNCPNLTAIDKDAFADLLHLQHLDLSDNALSTLSPKSLRNLPTVESVSLSGNRWYCGCQLKLLRDVLSTIGSGCGDDVVCNAPPPFHGVSLMHANYSGMACPDDVEEDIDMVVAVPLGSVVTLDSPFSVNPAPKLAWYSSHGKIVERTIEFDAHTHRWNVSYEIRDANMSNSARLITVHRQHGQDDLSELESGIAIGEHMKLYLNGSLLFEGMTRRDTGRYRCRVTNAYENITVVVELRLDYDVMSSVMLSSLVIGGASAIGFFSIAVFLGAVRYFAHVCSAEERAKRRSLRELLAQMRNSSQLDRLSAYRTAKMDRLSAFKSATMDQLSAFTSNRIGQLRKYKQATVSSVLHQLERMREHYVMQTVRIKDSYTSNVERLRHSYALQRSRLHDRRSVGVRRMREQYRARTARAREYSIAQVARLRDQYKQQQMYLLKLLELIDVGSCVSSAVEAECVRAESAIFDAGVILFDEEARPSHATRTDEPGFRISDPCISRTRSTHSLPDMDDAGEDVGAARGALLPRSVSASDIDVGHEMTSKPRVIDDCSVIVHTMCQKSLSTPVVCIVHQSEDGRVGPSATIREETRGQDV